MNCGLVHVLKVVVQVTSLCTHSHTSGIHENFNWEHVQSVADHLNKATGNSDHLSSLCEEPTEHNITAFEDNKEDTPAAKCAVLEHLGRDYHHGTGGTHLNTGGTGRGETHVSEKHTDSSNEMGCNDRCFVLKKTADVCVNPTEFIHIGDKEAPCPAHAGSDGNKYHVQPDIKYNGDKALRIDKNGNLHDSISASVDDEHHITNHNGIEHQGTSDNHTIANCEHLQPHTAKRLCEGEDLQSYLFATSCSGETHSNCVEVHVKSGEHDKVSIDSNITCNCLTANGGHFVGKSNVDNVPESTDKECQSESVHQVECSHDAPCNGYLSICDHLGFYNQYEEAKVLDHCAIHHTFQNVTNVHLGISIQNFIDNSGATSKQFIEGTIENTRPKQNKTNNTHRKTHAGNVPVAVASSFTAVNVINEILLVLIVTIVQVVQVDGAQTSRTNLIIAESRPVNYCRAVADPHGENTPRTPEDYNGGATRDLEVKFEVYTSADNLCIKAGSSQTIEQGDETISVSSKVKATPNKIIGSPRTTNVENGKIAVIQSVLLIPILEKAMSISQEQLDEHHPGGGAQNGCPLYKGEKTETANINNRADGGAVLFVLPHRLIVGHGPTRHIPKLGSHDPGLIQKGSAKSLYELKNSDAPPTAGEKFIDSSGEHHQSMGNLASSFKPGPHEGYSNVHNCDHRKEVDKG